MLTEEFVKLAQRQVGTKESPLGSNKTKYGVYFDKGNIYINVYDGDRDQVAFYLCGNSVTETFVKPIVAIMETNNSDST